MTQVSTRTQMAYSFSLSVLATQDEPKSYHSFALSSSLQGLRGARVPWPICMLTTRPTAAATVVLTLFLATLLATTMPTLRITIEPANIT